MPSADVQGKFLWHELMTSDPAAAGAFYGKVLGWTPQAWDKDPSYTVLLTPKGPVGGIMKSAADAQGTGPSAQWVPYVGVASVDETAAAVQRLGGRVLKGATDIAGGGGRYAVLADPQGGMFGIHTPPATSAGTPGSEAFTWHELATADHAAAFRFYGEIFGWEKLGVHDMGAMGAYLLFGRGGQQFGGMFNRPSSMTSAWPHWLAYVRVSSAAKTAEVVRNAGGRVANGPHQVPGGSWIVQLIDPQGAAIAVNQPQATVEGAPAPKAASAPPVQPAPKPAGAAPAKPAPKPAAGAATPASAPAPVAARHAAAVPTTAAAAKPSGASKPAGVTAPATVAGAKPAARKAAARKAGARKAGARKAGARKAGARKTARKTGARKASRGSRAAGGRRASGRGRASGGSAARRARTSGGARKRAAGRARSSAKSSARTAKRSAATRGSSRRGTKATAARSGRGAARSTARAASRGAGRRKAARRGRR